MPTSAGLNFPQLRIPRLLGLAVLLWICGMGAAGAAEAVRPLLINAQQSNYQSEPRFIRDRFEFIEKLPFDGMKITTDSGRHLMDGPPLSYSRILLDFAPLSRLRFKRMVHNFALVWVNRPADFFDDWSTTVENFRSFARVLRMRKIEGIFFDNEEYERGLFRYPDNCSYPLRPLADYQAQARLRGREIMEAMVREHPKLVVIVLHGPYSSFSGTPETVRGGQTRWEIEQLRGPFTVGMIEGLGKSASLVDGGEVYAYRSEAEFQESYDFRKTTIASAEAACPFIPAELRESWSQKVGISFGVYNLPFAGAPMDAAILKPTLERALRRADRYVWLYSEGLNWNAPGETAEEWFGAVAGARAAAIEAAGSVTPTVVLTSPGNRVLLRKATPVTLTARAVSAGRTISKVEFFKGPTKLGEALAAPFEYVWANPPAGTYQITARATDSAGAIGVSSAAKVTFRSGFAVRTNFQAAGVTPSVGYFSDAGEVYGARPGGLTYGWNVSHTGNARRRVTSSIDLHLATLCQMQAGGVWEIAVPSGSYLVTVGIGDSDSASTHTVNVEGVKFWSAVALPAGKFLRMVKRVQVTDGKLTLDQGAAGFEATRVNFISIVGS